MPEPYRSAHDDYLRRYLSQDHAQLRGSIRKLTAQRRDGSTLPIELSLGEVVLGGQRFFIGAIREVEEAREGDGLLERLHTALDSDLRPALASILGDLQLLRQGAAGRLPGKAKPMVEIGGKPILWHIMKHYAHHGCDDFFVRVPTVRESWRASSEALVDFFPEILGPICLSWRFGRLVR